MLILDSASLLEVQIPKLKAGTSKILEIGRNFHPLEFITKVSIEEITRKGAGPNLGNLLKVRSF